MSAALPLLPVLPRDQLSKDAYMSSSHQATTINHFYEKLLKLKVSTEPSARHGAHNHAAACLMLSPVLMPPAFSLWRVGVCLPSQRPGIAAVLPTPGPTAAERAVGNSLVLAALPLHVLHRT